MDSSSIVPVQGRKTWFRWCLRWGLKGIVLLALLIVLFYLEEDWRGARAWAQAKAEIQAQGISLDPQAYIPPPVPDAENFGALPIFQLEPDPKQKGVLKTLALDRALSPIHDRMSFSKDEGSKPGMLPYLGNWNRGEKPDMTEAQKRLTELCGAVTPSIQVSANASPTEMLDLLCPALSKLRGANAIHPLCRFEHDYLHPISMMRTLDLTVKQIMVAKVLSYEERLALYDGQSQLALDDMNVDWKIVAGLQKEPLIVSGLVAAGVVSIQLAGIREGLDQHIWNDQQLAELDAALGKLDFLSETQLCLRGDFVVTMIPWLSRAKTDRLSIFRETREAQLALGSDQKPSWQTYFLLLGDVWLPSNGDIDSRLAENARSVVLGSDHAIDATSRRVFSEKEPNESNVSSQSQSVLRAINKFAYAQVQVDEARIACRLERYRLAHDSYPNTLEALIPAYGAELPHDIMNGEPYHYKLNGDGTYVLYSVGWDQKDDGGQLGTKSPYHNSDNLDWIWTNYPDLAKK